MLRTKGAIKPWARRKRGQFYISNGVGGPRRIIRLKSGGRKRYAVYVMEKALSYKIPKGYCVHHKDGDTLNDLIDNLELLSASSHSKLHHLGKKNPRKGRKGELHAHKLTQQQVAKIRKLYSTNKLSQQQLAAQFKVHQTMVSHIVTGRSW